MFTHLRSFQIIGAGFQGRLDIAAMLFKHGVGLRDVHEDGHEPISKWMFYAVILT